MATTEPQAEPFRFFDNRQKYLAFVNTCNEKAVVGARASKELGSLLPRPPALRMFDAGMGDATVLTRLVRAQFLGRWEPRPEGLPHALHDGLGRPLQW